MDRRNFLTRSGLALGALIVGDEALEALARLTHVRKSFPSAGVPRGIEGVATAREIEEWRYVRLLAEIDVSGLAAVHYEASCEPNGGYTRLKTLHVLDGERFVFNPGGLLPRLDGEARVDPAACRVSVAMLGGGGGGGIRA